MNNKSPKQKLRSNKKIAKKLEFLQTYHEDEIRMARFKLGAIFRHKKTFRGWKISKHETSNHYLSFLTDQIKRSELTLEIIKRMRYEK